MVLTPTLIGGGALALVVVVALYWLLPRAHRDTFVAVASLAVVGWFDPVGAVALYGFCLLFFAATTTPGGGWRVRVPVLAILGYLAWFKYVPRLMPGGQELAQVAVPLGISYFTFKLIHFGVERGRGKFADCEPSEFLCYMLMLPTFTAGPIERFDHFREQRVERWDGGLFVDGVWRITVGLIKKFAISNTIETHLLRDHLTALHESTASVSTAQAWWICLLVYLTVYLDFSAYSDLAIGFSRLLGIRIAENFRWPILAPNIVEFWQRWHISLSRWCRDYVYLPTIGLTRRPLVAILCTFLAIGLWHDGTAAFAAWGLYHATGVAFYQVVWRRWRSRLPWSTEGRAWRVVGVVLTVAFVAGSFALTAVPTTLEGQRAALVGKLCGWH